MASGTKWSRSQDQVGGHGLMSLLRMGQGLNYCASLGMGSFLGTSNVGLFETSSMGDVDPICQYDGRKSEKMMLASPLDPLPDLRKDFRPWSISWREDHGTVRKAELVTKIRQREQRTKNKGRVTVTATVWWVTKAELVTKTMSKSDTVFVTSSTFGQPQSFDNDRAQGQGLGARTEFVGFEFRTCWFSCWTESHSLGHPEAPRGDFDQISGTVVCLLARLQGAHLEVLWVGVPRVPIWWRWRRGAWGCPRCTNAARCTAKKPSSPSSAAKSTWLSSRLANLAVKVLATAKITRRPGCSWTERRSESDPEWGSQEGPSWAFLSS